MFDTLKKINAITETKKIMLSPQADEYATEYFHTPEKRIEDGLDKAKAWNGKAFGLSVRLAALFHAYQCYEDGKEPAEIPISVDTMKNAAAVVECLAVHAQKVFAGDDQRNDDAFYLLNRIKRHVQPQITKRKMWQGVKSRFKNVDHLNEILTYLEERGYIKIEIKPTGGRPAETIKVNPAFLHDVPATN